MHSLKLWFVGIAVGLIAGTSTRDVRAADQAAFAVPEASQRTFPQEQKRVQQPQIRPPRAATPTTPNEIDPVGHEWPSYGEAMPQEVSEFAPDSPSVVVIPKGKLRHRRWRGRLRPHGSVVIPVQPQPVPELPFVYPAEVPIGHPSDGADGAGPRCDVQPTYPPLGDSNFDPQFPSESSIHSLPHQEHPEGYHESTVPARTIPVLPNGNSVVVPMSQDPTDRPPEWQNDPWSDSDKVRIEMWCPTRMVLRVNQRRTNSVGSHRVYRAQVPQGAMDATFQFVLDIRDFRDPNWKRERIWLDLAAGDTAQIFIEEIRKRDEFGYMIECYEWRCQVFDAQGKHVDTATSPGFEGVSIHELPHRVEDETRAEAEEEWQRLRADGTGEDEIESPAVTVKCPVNSCQETVLSSAPAPATTAPATTAPATTAPATTAPAPAPATTAPASAPAP